MKGHDSRGLIGEFVDFINDPTEAKAKELISGSIELRTPIRPEPFRGPTGYVEILGHLRSAFPDVQWRIDETIAEGDRVACRFTATGTHNGDFMGIAPTGKRVEWHPMNFYEFRDGMLMREHANPDLLTVLAQLGAIPCGPGK